MKNGHLNKTELRTVATCYEKLIALRDKITVPTPGQFNQRNLIHETCARDLLHDSAGKLAELLRWQDYAGEWQRVSKSPPPQVP
jgi:hypothetical protein